MKLSVVIIAFNEEKHIGACIDSALFADEVLVIDSCSSDSTVTIAKEKGAKVIINPWPGFAQQRQFGIEKAQGAWIVFLDADERITSELKKRIVTISNENDHPVDGYEIPRRNFVCGREMKHMWPARSLRFFKRAKGSMTLQREVHEKVLIDGNVSRLKEPMLHYTYDTMEQYFTKMNAYTSLLARQSYDKEKKRSLSSLYGTSVLRFFHYFIDLYISRGAVRDGVFGFYLSLLHAISGMSVYFKIVDLKRNDNDKTL